MARSMSVAESAAGIDARLVIASDESTWDNAVDARIHVCHVHFPPKVRARLEHPPKVVWVGHGTPEYTFAMSVEEGRVNKGKYGFSDSFMLMQNWLPRADAAVTFWPRHQWIYQTMTPRPVHVVPMGVDRSFWCPGKSAGKWAGSPSLFTAENAHRGKWPLDLLLLWPYVADQFHEAVLHVCNLPQDEHRWWFPLANANGAHFRSYLSSIRWGPEDLRNVFRSIDYFIGLVEYGDHNHLMMQAKASGATCISYRGNPYADYWLTPGDQRVITQELLDILTGKTAKRESSAAPDIAETAEAMRTIYEGLLT